MGSNKQSTKQHIQLVMNNLTRSLKSSNIRSALYVSDCKEKVKRKWIFIEIL